MNGPMTAKCTEARANEIFLNRLDNQLTHFENLLDTLVYKVAPVSIHRPSCVKVNDKNLDEEEEQRSPLINELYTRSIKLSEILDRLEYITGGVVI